MRSAGGSRVFLRNHLSCRQLLLGCNERRRDGNHSKEITTMLEIVGFHTPTEDLTWCTTAPDLVDFTVSVKRSKINRRSRKSAFKVLGSLISFDYSCDVEIQ